MFTGIVTDIGTIAKVTQSGDTRFDVLTAYDTDTIDLGASISHSGVCLTVIEKGKGADGDWFAVEASKETLDVTSAGKWQEGTKLNLERALKMGDELGGHILSGHIMSTARILQRTQKGEGIDLLIEHQADTKPYILEKGYIAVDGMSLTVGEVQSEGFNLHIIPETLRITTIGEKTEGDLVNIEVDSRTQAVVDTIRSMEVER